jgi:prepilin-type N-terminal cleavage/methylation domain-containing protein
MQRPGPGFPRSAGFTLVELLIVVMVIGVLAAIASPSLLAARRRAVETSVIRSLQAMSTNQQMFYPNPVPLTPSSPTDLSQRFARLHELNSFSRSIFGKTVSFLYIDAPRVRYSMVPLWPSVQTLRGRFVIQAVETGLPRGALGFWYQVDESGRVVKLR